MSLVEKTVTDHSARLTLNRPAKLNAVSSAVRRDLTAALDDAIADPDVRVIVLAGAGRAFCGGQDIAEMKDLSLVEDDRSAEYYRLFDTLRTCPKPIIVRWHGHVAGAGLQMSLLCDLRIAGESAGIGMTEFTIGLPVLLGSQLLTAVVGEAAMRRIVLYSDFVSGDEALRLGLATEVHPDDRLDARIDQIAAGLAARNPDAVRRTKLGWAETSEPWFRGMMEQAARLRGPLNPEWDR